MRAFQYSSPFGQQLRVHPVAWRDLFIVEPLCLYSQLVISSTHNNVNYLIALGLEFKSNLANTQFAHLCACLFVCLFVQ